MRFATLALLSLLLLIACMPATDATSAAPQATQASSGGQPQAPAALRPIFYDSFANWCSTCQINKPVIDGLKAEFGDRVDFVALSIDDNSTLPVRQKFDLVQRSRYALVAPDSETVVQRWFGLLNEAQVADYLRDYLASLP